MKLNCLETQILVNVSDLFPSIIHNNLIFPPSTLAHRRYDKRTGEPAKPENLADMDMEEEKRSLIHREIDKFRDTYKVSTFFSMYCSLGIEFLRYDRVSES